MPISTTIAAIIVLVVVLISLIGIGAFVYYVIEIFFLLYRKPTHPSKNSASLDASD